MDSSRLNMAIALFGGIMVSGSIIWENPFFHIDVGIGFANSFHFGFVWKFCIFPLQSESKSRCGQWDDLKIEWRFLGEIILMRIQQGF